MHTQQVPSACKILADFSGRLAAVPNCFKIWMQLLQMSIVLYTEVYLMVSCITSTLKGPFLENCAHLSTPVIQHARNSSAESID